MGKLTKFDVYLFLSVIMMVVFSYLLSLVLYRTIVHPPEHSVVPACPQSVQPSETAIALHPAANGDL